jgi:glycosyltransferase involved in cell wall biosynthesis
MQKAWMGDMPTISVARTLIPGLKEYGNSRIIGVVPNGKDANKYYNENRQRDGVGVVLYDHPNKCYGDTLRTIQKIRENFQDTKIYAFGKIKLPKEISYIEYHRLPSIDKIRELYNRSKVWFSTSKDEGLPNPLLEAMACGTAVVSTVNLGSQEVIKNGENGYLVPVGDITEITQKISCLLKNDDLREKMVNKANVTFKKYSWKNSAKALDDILSSSNEWYR